MLRARIVEQAVDQREIEPPLVGLDQFPAYRYAYRIEVEPGQPFPARRPIRAARRPRIGKLDAGQHQQPPLDDERAPIEVRDEAVEGMRVEGCGDSGGRR